MSYKAWPEYLVANHGLSAGAIYSFPAWDIFETTDEDQISKDDMKRIKDRWELLTLTSEHPRLELQNGIKYYLIGDDPETPRGRIKGDNDPKGIHIIKSKNFLIVGISNDGKGMGNGQTAVYKCAELLKNQNL